MSTTLSILASLFVIEILLSVDNALVNATIAESLPEKQRSKALRIGIILGALFRLVALSFAAFVIHSVWIKIAGGLYLVYLAVSHLSKKTNEEKGITFSKKAYFSQVIWQIAFADIVFSIDNVISAVSFSEKTAIVILGVFIGMLSMLFITPLLSKLIHTYKGMPQAAYTIVGLVGLSLVVQTFFHKEMGEVGKGLVIASIIVFTLCYEHSSHLRRVSNPFLRGVQLFLSIPRESFFLLRQIFIVIWKK